MVKKVLEDRIVTVILIIKIKIQIINSKKWKNEFTAS